MVNDTISQFSAKLMVPERLWKVREGRAKGRSLEADRINRHQNEIRSQFDRHYQDIRDRGGDVTAEKVKNAWLGFGKRYRTLLATFRSFTDDLHERIGVDRSKNTWYRYLATMKHLQAFLTVEYHVSDIALAELEQSFIEQFHLYAEDGTQSQIYEYPPSLGLSDQCCQDHLQRRDHAPQPVRLISL